MSPITLILHFLESWERGLSFDTKLDHLITLVCPKIAIENGYRTKIVLLVHDSLATREFSVFLFWQGNDGRKTNHATSKKSGNFEIRKFEINTVPHVKVLQVQDNGGQRFGGHSPVPKEEALDQERVAGGQAAVPDI